MHGRAIELLDELISVVWSPSSWDDQEGYYLEEHAPRIARSDDPEFRWIEQENERLVLKRLRALMADDEWRILPELIRARRGLTLRELESDRGRPARLAAWTVALDRARREGEARLALEQQQQAAARDAGERSGRREAGQQGGATPGSRPPPKKRTEPPARRSTGPRGLARQRGRPVTRRPSPPTATPPGGAREAASATSAADPGGACDALVSAARADQVGGTGAAAASIEAPPSATGESTADGRRDDGTEGRLRELAELAAEGLISTEEHEQHRRRVIVADAGQEEDMSDETLGSGRPDEASGSPADGEATEEEQPRASVAGAAPNERASDGEHPADQPMPADAPAPTPSPEQAGPARGGAPPGATPPGGVVVVGLRGYALELTDAGEPALADAVHEYAERVRGVERGELPAAVSVAPAAITPQMVGAALVRSRLEGWVELLRNLLIFMPVLWTWLKLQDAVAAYPGGSTTNFFDYWVEQGGSTPVVGGTLADAALQVALVLVVLVVVNAFLGVLRSRTERRRDREARRFAAVLARAEAAGAARRADDPQSALAGFAVAATGLTTELRSVGETLRHSAAPFAESVELARRALADTTEAVAAQQRRLDDVIEHLGGIAGMGDQLAELRAEFAEARAAADRSALALGGIRDSLDPSARDFAAAAGTLVQLATHLERMAEAMAGTVATLDGGLASSTEQLRDAATSMNTLAARVLDGLDDGRGSRR